MKIAILGSHPATRSLAPFSDGDWTIWACSPHNARNLPRHDAWFELHDPVEDPTRPPRYLAWVKSLPLVFMRDRAAIADYPGAVAYPEPEMRARFGPFFFTSSIAYMLAKAIADLSALPVTRPKTIGIWGVMQATPTEYSYQRPGIQYFIQRARESGIEVVAPDVARLFEPQRVAW